MFGTPSPTCAAKPAAKMLSELAMGVANSLSHRRMFEGFAAAFCLLHRGGAHEERAGIELLTIKPIKIVSLCTPEKLANRYSKAAK
jgi:hypothetical protein